MKDKYQQQWENLGATDPYWAVLTDPAMKEGKWNHEDFFNTGKNEIQSILSKIEDLNVTMNSNVALDFGCGVGRLSRALACHFNKVIAVDISSSMLEEAEKANQNLHNIEFTLNVSEDLKTIPNESVDFLYSNMVLQHMPKHKQKLYIEEFCRVLAPKGIIAVQTPSKHRLDSFKSIMHMALGNNVLNIIRKFKYGSNSIMEVHALSEKKVLNILKSNRVELISQERFDSAGPMFESYIYIAKKN